MKKSSWATIVKQHDAMDKGTMRCTYHSTSSFDSSSNDSSSPLYSSQCRPSKIPTKCSSTLSLGSEDSSASASLSNSFTTSSPGSPSYVSCSETASSSSEENETSMQRCLIVSGKSTKENKNQVVGKVLKTIQTVKRENFDCSKTPIDHVAHVVDDQDSENDVLRKTTNNVQNSVKKVSKKPVMLTRSQSINSTKSKPSQQSKRKSRKKNKQLFPADVTLQQGSHPDTSLKETCVSVGRGKCFKKHLGTSKLSHELDQFLSDNTDLIQGKQSPHLCGMSTANDAKTAYKVLKEAITEVFSNVIVNVYGSLATNLWLPEISDLDVALKFTSHGHKKNGSKPELLNLQSEQRVTYLRVLESALRRKEWCSNIQVIDGKMPLIKGKIYMNEFQGRGINMDISVFTAGEHKGLANMQFIKSLDVSLPGVFAPILMVAKRLLHLKHLHEVYRGGPGSYALILLVAFYLERCGFLINTSGSTAQESTNETEAAYSTHGTILHDRVVPYLHPRGTQTSQFVLDTENHFKMVTDQVLDALPDGSTPTLDMLLMGFLRFYATIEFSQVALSLERRGSLHAIQGFYGHLCIWDPVSKDNPVGMSAYQIPNIQRYFNESAILLESGADLLSLLHWPRENKNVIPKSLPESTVQTENKSTSEIQDVQQSTVDAQSTVEKEEEDDICEIAVKDGNEELELDDGVKVTSLSDFPSLKTNGNKNIGVRRASVCGVAHQDIKTYQSLWSTVVQGQDEKRNESATAISKSDTRVSGASNAPTIDSGMEESDDEVSTIKFENPKLYNEYSTYSEPLSPVRPRADTHVGAFTNFEHQVNSVQMFVPPTVCTMFPTYTMVPPPIPNQYSNCSPSGPPPSPVQMSMSVNSSPIMSPMMSPRPMMIAPNLVQMSNFGYYLPSPSSPMENSTVQLSVARSPKLAGNRNNRSKPKKFNPLEVVTRECKTLKERRIYVGHINYTASTEERNDLVGLFRQFGKCKHVLDDGKNIWITYETQDSATNAVQQMHKYKFKEMELIVEFTTNNCIPD